MHFVLCTLHFEPVQSGSEESEGLFGSSGEEEEEGEEEEREEVESGSETETEQRGSGGDHSTDEEVSQTLSRVTPTPPQSWLGDQQS